jgi:hypothetical protein
LHSLSCWAIDLPVLLSWLKRPNLTRNFLGHPRGMGLEEARYLFSRWNLGVAKICRRGSSRRNLHVLDPRRKTHFNQGWTSLYRDNQDLERDRIGPSAGRRTAGCRRARGGRPLPYPQVKRNGRIFPPDPKALERALEPVYNTLRSRLGAEARQTLERDQLGWLINRETWRTNADPGTAT